MSSSEMDERVTDEIEALSAILLDDELKVTRSDSGIPTSIEAMVFPSTGEDSRSQYVCVTLIIDLPKNYPDECPSVHLKNPRGLDEATVQQIDRETESKCLDFIGQPVLFELIELVREHLTQSNLPTGQCAVCLYGFRDGDEFTKTECYHHFHSHCLASHIVAANKFHREELEKLPQWQQDLAKQFQAICPVCRESINCDVEILCLAPPPIDVETATEFSITAELRELQRQMSILFSRQQERGGIIDPEAEGVKMLLRTEEDPAGGMDEPSLLAGPSFPDLSRANVRSEAEIPVPQQQKNSHKDKQSDNRQPHNDPRDSHDRHGRRYRGRGRSGNNSHRRNCDRLRQNESTPR